MSFRTSMPWLAVSAIATAVCLPMLLYGAPYGADMFIHVSWAQRFTEQLWSGDLYPRWLAELNSGAGSPTFFYYAPFPYYVSGIFGPLLCPGCAPLTHVAIGFWLMLLGSGLAFYAFARRYGAPWAAAAGAMVYMLLTYHFEIDLWRRFAYGEFAAYIWMPLILLAYDKTLEERRFLPACALSYAGLLLSHLPAALLFSIVFGAYALLQTAWRKSPQPLLMLAAAVALGSGAAGLYLVPALAAQGYIHADQMYVPQSGKAQRLWNYDFFNYRNWLFLDGRNEPSTRMATRVRNGLIGGTVIFALSALAIWRARGKSALRDMASWALALAIVWVVVTPLGIPLFELVPLMKKVDFPFRIVIVADLAAAALLVVALQVAGRRRDTVSRILLGLAGAVVLGFLVLSGGRFARPFQPFPFLLEPFQTREVIESHRAKIASGWDSLEFFMPIWTTLSFEDFRAAAPQIPRLASRPGGAGEVQIALWEPRKIDLNVDLREPAYLTVKQFYFPTWRARNAATGASLPVKPQEKTGLVEIAAPAGRYDIELRLEPLWQERAGAALSVATLLGLASFYGLLRGRERRRPRAFGGRLTSRI